MFCSTARCVKFVTGEVQFRESRDGVKCAEEVVASGAGGTVFVSDFLEWSWCDTWRWTWSRGEGCRGATSFHNYSCTPLNHTCSPWWRSVSVRWCVVEKECCVKDKKRRDLVRIPRFWTFENVSMFCSTVRSGKLCDR